MSLGLVVDTSVIVAIVETESEAPAFERALETAARRAIAAPSVLEAMIVLSRRRGGDSEAIVNAMIAAYGIEIVPFDGTLIGAAFSAFLKFGKGRHQAALNFGDCFSYALALAREEPLLFKAETSLLPTPLSLNGSWRCNAVPSPDPSRRAGQGSTLKVFTTY